MPKRYPIGFWIDHADLRAWLKDNDYAGLFALLDAIQPASTLIMDGLSLAVRIKERYPDMVVIHRDYSGYEGSEWEYRHPQDMVNRWLQQGHPEIVRYTTNEPSYGAHNAARFAKHEADTIQLAYEQGIQKFGQPFQVVCFNESVGGFEISWLPSMNELWHTVIKHNAFIGYHSYMTAIQPAAFMPIEWLSDPVTEGIEYRSRLQPEQWTIPDLTPRKDAPYYWMLREIGVIKHFMELGYTEAQLTGIHIDTEYGYDNIKGGNTYVNAILDTLRLKYGEARFNFDMRGIATYKNLHAAYFPEMTFFERIGKEFNWWQQIISKAFWKHSSVFYAINTDWFDPEGFDISHDEMRPIFPVWIDLAKSYRESTQPMPEPIPDFVEGVDYIMEATTISTQGGTFIRSERSQISAETIHLQGDQTIEALVSDKALWSGIGHLWKRVYYEREGTDTKVWWVAYENSDGKRTNAVFTPLVVTPPDTGDDTPPPDTGTPTAEQIAQAVADYMATLTETVTVDIPFPNYTYATTKMNIEAEKQFWRILHNMSGVILNRLENPTPTLSQIANEIYSTATVEPSLDTHTNVSDLGSDMILDEMMNPSAEDDNEKLAS